MSHEKMDRSFPSKIRVISDEEIAQIVAIGLRQDFGNTASSIKHIGRLTGVNLRAIKNWYEAKNAPSSGHLLLLSRSSPSILKFMLSQIGGNDLWDAFKLHSGINMHQETDRKSIILKTTDGSSDVPINVPTTIYNARQRWFLVRIRRAKYPRAIDISHQFNVTLKTAKRDIDGLKSTGKIQFIGSNKTGKYVIS